MASSDTRQEFTTEDIKGILTKHSDESDLVDYLVSNIERTRETLNCNVYGVDDNIQVLFMLSLAFHCPINKENVIYLMTAVRDSKFYKERLGLLLGAPDLPKNDIYEFCKVLGNCVELIAHLSTKLPSTIEETATFGLIAILKSNIQEILPDLDGNLRDEMCTTFETVIRLQDDTMKRLLSKERASTIDSRFEKNLPPDDFRQIPILPNESDIVLSRVFLRPNKRRGGYDNLRHYLDVQFRLYREDCISPLRDGIVEYVRERSAGRNVGRLQDGRLYREVVASKPEYSMEGLSVTITIDKRHSSRIKWKTSHRLLYGSLVCLSHDHFQTMYFAVVSESDRDTLEKFGTFKVQFAFGTKNAKCPLQEMLTMVESTAYYESYRHVLASLQNIEDGDLPFEKYIVYCKKNVEPPKYLEENKHVTYDFEPIMSNDVICRRDTGPKVMNLFSSLRLKQIEQRQERRVSPFSPIDDWPSKDELHLDESQLKAFYSALTEEFVLIQGPPGTGKTHVGLQIAKTLLHNKSEWRTRFVSNEYSATVVEENCALLIVCFTNHALDQFLEGIIEFHDKRNRLWINDIVRVGGRSQSEKLENFALKKRRWSYRHDVDRVDEVSYMEEVGRIQKKMAYIRWCLHKTKSVVLSPKVLQDILGEKYFHLFCKQRKSKRKQNENKRLAEWLAATEHDWIRRATLSYSEGIKKHYDKYNKSESHIKENVDVETDAQRAEDDRRIEEDELVVEFDEDIGLDVNVRLRELLLKYDKEGIDDIFRDLLKSEVSDIVQQLESTKTLSVEQIEKLDQNILKIPVEDRWCLYRHWLDKYCKHLKGELQSLNEYQKSIYREYQREKQEIDSRILKNSTVIAMTTTGAAKYQEVLREIGPRIIIVEEAAEVLEAHIIATLSPKCEHLILIGDHKQLEPKPTVYELAVRYNIGLSMFERMINNGLSFHCLQWQHRMRPEISTLVRHIYPVLIDNENVKHYDHVLGVKKDVYFISHKQTEQFREDIRSYSNEYEAKYIMRLCRYLMLQGYKAEQITVLAAYNGQMFSIRDIMPKHEFFGVRVCAIDNYQGEENDFVVLSLVRSNEKDSIGFLKRENRICVALSRAKIGMYVIGNFGILGKCSSLWRKVMGDMRIEGAISDALPLYCQNHTEKTIMARTPDDFDKAPNGGCELDCDFRLPCGHSCRFKCHPIDRKHLDYQCERKCLKICINGHICRRLCHHNEDCKCDIDMEKYLRCEHTMKMKCCENPDDQVCKVMVQRKLDKCGHEVQMECFEDPDTFSCKVVVTKTLPCEHEVDIHCYIDPLRYKCMIQVTGTRSCGHTYELPCYHNKPLFALRYKCKEIVTRKRACGHEYDLACSENELLYIRQNKCKTVVKKTFSSCGHTLETECHVEIDTLSCQHVVLKRLDCSHAVEVKCFLQHNVICNHKCFQKCENGHICHRICHFGSPCNCENEVVKSIPMCGHEQKMLCYKDPFLEYCNTKVIKMLPTCGHKHEMDCGQSTNDIECKKIVTKVVPLCGHKNKMLCCSDPFLFCECVEIVSKTLTCGHRKKMKCCVSERMVKCDVIVAKILLCGHKTEMKCSENISDITCVKKTFKKLPGCNHDAEMICSDDNFKAVRCNVAVSKSLPKCGHVTIVPCYKAVNDIKCVLTVMKDLACGHSYEMKCFESMNIKQLVVCREKVTVYFPCKHKIEVECSLQETTNCTLKCNAILSCGHSCTGKCGECFRSLSHPPCTKPCGKNLVCGHFCRSGSCGSCRSCEEICLFHCPHTACEHACGIPCKPCNKPCTWICPHQRCTKTCDEECDRPRCNVRCPKTLECLHQCLGFCGDPCPDICGECNSDKLRKLTEDQNISDEMGTVVSLQECGHLFHADQLDKYFEKNDSVPRCPSCYTIIRWHPRYNKVLKKVKKMQNQIKFIISDVERKEACTVKFPVIRQNFEDVINFCKQCRTFLILQDHSSEEDTEEIDRYREKALHLICKLLQFLDDIKQRDLREQTLSDIFNEVYEIAALWMMSSVQQFLKAENNTLASEMNDNEKTLPTSNNVYLKFLDKKRIGKQAIDVIDNSSSFTLELLCNVQSILQPHFGDLEQLALATNYPVFEGIANVHADDWRVCKKGHLEPKSGHRCCVQCVLGRKPDLDVFMKNRTRYGKLQAKNLTNAETQAVSENTARGNRRRGKQRKNSKSNDEGVNAEKQLAEREANGEQGALGGTQSTSERHEISPEVWQFPHTSHPQSFGKEFGAQHEVQQGRNRGRGQRGRGRARGRQQSVQTERQLRAGVFQRDGSSEGNWREEQRSDVIANDSWRERRRGKNEESLTFKGGIRSGGSRREGFRGDGGAEWTRGGGHAEEIQRGGRQTEGFRRGGRQTEGFQRVGDGEGNWRGGRQTEGFQRVGDGEGNRRGGRQGERSRGGRGRRSGGGRRGRRP